MNKLFGSFDMDSSSAKSINVYDSRRHTRMVAESASLESAEQVHDYNVQNNIRKLYGKPGINNAVIGGHPDFDYLVESRTWEKGFVTSLFVDIQGSTRLGVYYSPEMVYFFKNQIIKCAIECVLAFDGHVHRIMGDAVLAFFRGQGNANNSAIDAINCGAVLVQYIREEVVPKLRERGLDEDVGIRVGIDYGSHEQVLWGMYGYAGVSEVTATSFHVDVAAKLQQSAPRNRVMLGQSVVELLDLHNEVIEVKRAVNGGEKIYLPFVSPNYKDVDGRPMNYRQYVLSQDKYSALLPYPEDADYPIEITSTIKREPGLYSEDHYYKCSRSVPLRQGIEFKALFWPVTQAETIQVKFRVENNGKQAEAAENKGDHETLVTAVRRENGQYFAKHWERSSYLGLHYMFISVYENGALTHREQRYSLFIG
ncbi:TPA: adenylate/guanylate cyclase domain-containing protein [Pseudomonas aeruginosa]|nr:adenylate/guanylate cyclase domain-containing protein [Pseudomonas aeruginosa]MBX5858798.1 adenylate/guanylate cyclase domain-containing protein [Pseudomonas aeruginosa]MCD2811990.1 adenylate/guanylate cyclase domain-containing protein [Pseudomonas aeruginosa]MCH0752645.1 adenylate/guanylate cyclase domain-containing protein [Pseudomonas aeruginosa]RWX86083.1 adenylate/guanylate cyclase domain-containing protein [Pseudomonas aeruginosa]